jgi:hypothetical protein
MSEIRRNTDATEDAYAVLETALRRGPIADPYDYLKRIEKFQAHHA